MQLYTVAVTEMYEIFNQTILSTIPLRSQQKVCMYFIKT